LGQKDVVAYKVLVVIHKLLREGHPQVIIDSHLRMSFFEQLRLNYRRLPTEYGRLIANYVTFLIDKINFHHLHPEVDGGISLEKFMQTRHETLNVEKGYVILFPNIWRICFVCLITLDRNFANHADTYGQ
jgi:hypothetical protein